MSKLISFFDEFITVATISLKIFNLELYYLDIAIAPDGTFAAFCHCEISPEDNARNGRNEGWIVTLGTRRGFRKQGLGRAIRLAGMHRLKAAGVEIARLSVDTENPLGTLRLYESVGFHPVHTNISFVKDVQIK